MTPIAIKQTCRVLCTGVALLFINQTSFAQTVSDADRHTVVTRLTDRLVDVYPFPEISAKYKEALLKLESEGRYNNLTENELANRLTEDLRKTHKDVHLRVSRSAPQQGGGGQRRGGEDNSDQRANYGFKKVEIDGATSTAYVDIPGPFLASQEAFEMAAAAMNMSAYSKYVILDVRHNGGGSGQMGRFLASYFYNPGNEQYYLNGFYKDRKRDVQEWTYSYTPGKHMPNAKVYILSGRSTGSASEGFAYAMQKLKRATIVGDTSAGAGIAGGNVQLGSNLQAFIPVKMVVGPNDNTGWEGIGVIPDVQTGKEDALVVARRLILEDIMKTSTDTVQKAAAQWVLDDAAIATGPADLKAKYGELVGKYTNNINITYVKGQMFWNRAEPGKPVESYLLKEVKPDVLVITGLNANIGPNVSRVYINRAGSKLESLTRKTLMGNGRISATPQPLKKI
ncbi:S41 family peptidase [Mucilaginibacter myungsuensis]|uniref:S41 family peptidase n=1 Tax=Mucilaginibacter myungsuensis TaxID=649104 RepID=A0A929PWL8_9SPHI|nr:S41 family peptidase [Mucilaginibacter myungsuensis]MBE9662226.1 S41 family peptidase [Mucilaginibacter myungsuensis]MDN3599338.1 S41 family peptidase [Mucilaginibacter myungsuensis]